MAWESLEARTLLATLNVAGGALTFNSAAGVADNLTIATTGPTGVYTVTDSTTTITLGAGAVAAGWSPSGPHSVSGPDRSVTSIAVDTKDGNDAVTVQSVDAPVALTFTNVTGNVDAVTIGGDPSKGTQGVVGAVAVNNLNGTTVLVVDDSGDTKAATVSFSGSKITGLLPGAPDQDQPNALDLSRTKLSSVTYDEGKGGTTLTISSTAKAPVPTTIHTGVGPAAVNVTTVQAVSGPLTIDARGTDTVTLGAAPLGVQNFGAPVTLETTSGGTIAVLNVDDSADIVGRTATISSATITGLAPSTVDYSAAALVALNVKGGVGGNTFTVAGLPDAIVTLSTGAGAALDPNGPNPNTVNVLGTSDPANQDTLIVNGQGLDTIKLAPSVALNVTGTTKLLDAGVSMMIDATRPGDRVGLTNSSSGSINGGVMLAGPAALTLDDSADTSARTALVSDGAISGLLPAPVYYSPDGISSLTIIGGGRPATLNVNAGKQGPVSVVPGVGVGAGTITIDSGPPLNYQNFVAVNVTNAADLPLGVRSSTVQTTTGDLPLEGKTFPYLVASFVDADVNARSNNYTAVIDWGDAPAGSPPDVSAGSISAQGYVGGRPLFDVTASHNYADAGTYTVVVTITDLGTAAVPSLINGIPVTVTDLGTGAVRTGAVIQVDLVSNGPIPAAHTDPHLVDAWGIAASPTGPFWVGDRGAGLATLYDGSGNPQSLAVTIPPPAGGSSPSSPTGVAFNPHSGGGSDVFDLVPGDTGTSAVFLFATADGTISGWNPGVPPPPPSPSNQAVRVVDNSAANAVYTGLAVADSGGSTFLYAANFHSGRVEIYDRDFAPVGSFTDSTLPSDYAPYDVANIGGNLYVTFAQQDAAGHAPVSGLGRGFVDVFSPSGTLLSRLASNAPLDEPWGVAMAPADFGQYSGDLLVANHGDGQIEAFDPATGAFVGPFLDSAGQAVTIDGLRGLSFGNGAAAGAANVLFFTAGPDGGTQGLLGSLTPQVLVSDGPDTTPAVSTVTIQEAALKASVVNVSAVEGNPFVGVVANFTDDNPLSQPGDFTATIDWGDGSTPTAGRVVAGNGLGAFLVVVDGTLAHTYTDETGSPVHPQPYNMSVRISETDGHASVSADGFANVADASLVSATGVDPSGTAVEGNPLASGPITLATFIDNNPLATPADFVTNGVLGTALIDWGDGSTSLGAVLATGSTSLGEGFAVTGNHTYLKVGPSSIKITVTDIGGKSTSMAANVLVIDAPLTAGPPITLLGTEGLPLTNAAGGTLVTVATFADANPFALATDYKAAIDWGDGTGGSGNVIAVGGGFAVTSQHKYAEAGTFVITVIVDDSAGDVGASRLIDPLAVIADAPLVAAAGNALSGVEGTSLSAATVATFTDLDPAATVSDFTVTITWGDGSAPDTTTGTVSIVGGTAAGVNFKVTGTHNYRFATGSPFAITVTVTDADGNALGPIASTATIADAPLSDIETGTIVAAEGAAVPAGTVVARFQDDNHGEVAGAFAATVNYGDGAGAVPANVTALGGGSFNVVVRAGSAPTYVEEGTFPILVTVTDIDGSTAVLTNDADVPDAALALAPAQPALPVAIVGVPLAIPPGTIPIVSFVDADPLAIVGPIGGEHSAEIDWGDGSPTSFGSISQPGGVGTAFLVNGNHTYLAPGVFKVSVHVADIGGSQLIIDPRITVRDQSISAAGATIAPTEGSPFSGVVATFTAPNPYAIVADYAATIDWPDGSTTQGAIALVGGTSSETSFLVSGDHTFAEEGDKSFNVTITTRGSNPASVTVTANIADATITAEHATFDAPEGVSMTQNVATFTDANPSAPATEFTATIAWGDGGSSAGNVTQPDGPGTPFLVSGTHTYDDPGGSQEMDGFPVTVTITEPGGSVAIATSQANVFDPVLIDPGSNVQAVAGSPFQGQVATFSSSDLKAGAGEFTAVIDWGDGRSSAGSIVDTGPGAFRVVGDHAYARPGTFSVSTTIRDDEGQSVSDTSTAAVSAPPIAGHGLTIAAGPRKSFAGDVATFTSPVAVPAGAFSALINWGDGTTSPGVVSSGDATGATTFSVSGSHHFSRKKPTEATVTIVESGGGQAVIPIMLGTGSGRHTGGSPQSHQGPRSRVATSRPVLKASHPGGPRAILQERLTFALR